MSKVIIKATNLREYGKGWQINAFVDGVESEGSGDGVGEGLGSGAGVGITPL